MSLYWRSLMAKGLVPERCARLFVGPYRQLILQETPMSNEKFEHVHVPSTTPIKADIPKAFIINSPHAKSTHFKLRSEGFGIRDILMFFELKEMMLLRNALNTWYSNQVNEDDIPF